MSSVAVKRPDTSTPGVLDRLHLGILAGVVYLIGSVAIVFELLPWLWFDRLGRSRSSAVDGTLLVLIGFAAAGGLAYLGRRLLGPSPTPGVKAGIFTTLVTLLVILLLTRWASSLFEGWVYDSGAISATVGIVLTVGVAVALLALAGRLLFLSPEFGPKMVAFEEQGWFSATSYKRLQGQRVRRGTILGILILVGCGIYSLVSHGSLNSTNDLALNIPFTGKARVTDLKDASPAFAGFAPKDAEGNPEVPFTTDLGTFREKNSQLKTGFVKVEDPKDAVEVTLDGAAEPVSFAKGEVVSKETFEKVRKKVASQKGTEPTISSKGPEPATAAIAYQHLTLLPHLRYTLPILLTALGLWFAWRVVNVPSFGDFLIATEAELNKVSWTTRSRLVQDTIVVLVTVILFTIFLFVVDVAWAKIMSWDKIGVLKIPEGGQGAQTLEQKW
jgi:preprotein translocase SecE subunit